MDVLMPDGTLVTGVPEGITQSDLLARYGKFSASKAEAPSPEASSITKNAEGQITGMGRDAYLAAVENRKQEIPERTLSGTTKDLGIALLKSAIAVPEFAVGVADLPTMGYAGKLLQDAGFKPKDAKEILDSYYSEAQQAASRRVSETKGLLPTVGAALENPSVVAQAGIESLASMLGGAGVAKGLMKAAPTLAPYLAGALGEGVVGAGSAAEQMRQESKDQLLSGKQVASAVGSGLGTAAFGIAGGKLANKLGLDDIDTLLAGGASKAATGGAKQTLGKSVRDFALRASAAGVSEGLFEEFPQSVQEQMWMNYAQDKPLMEGTAEAGGMGIVTGGAMGVGATALAGRRKATPGAPEAEAPPAPPGVPPVAPSKGPLAAAPSESMDTEAMLREALGEKPTVSAATVKEPKAQIQPTVAESGPFVRKQMEAQTPTTPTPVSIEGIPSAVETPKAVEAEAQGQQAPAAPAERLTLNNLRERPIEEQYTIINTVSFNAKKALREGRISQEDFDKINAEKDRITQEIGEKTLSNPTPDQKQALDLADQIEAVGQKDFADIIRKNVANGFFRKDTIPFYQEKLQEFQAQQGKTEAKEERFNWLKFLQPNEQKYYDTFQKTASPEAKAAFDKVSSSIQDITTALNNLGYQINDKKFPLGLGNLKTQHANLLSDGLQLLSGHYAIQNEYKRADADKYNLAIKRANDAAAQAQQLIRRAVPKPEEVADAETRVAKGERDISQIKGSPKLSLWSALTGKLGDSDMAELFGKKPQLYQKKLKAKQGGKSIADMVSDGDLNEFLPYKMRTDVPNFDGQAAEEYIKDKMRSADYIPYDAQVEIEQIFGSVKDAEELINDYLTTEEQNLELQKAADEQREGEINARSVEPESEIPPSEPDEGETLTKPTPEGLRAKEEYRNKAEAAEAAEAKANKEAEDKAKADKEVGEFTLTGSERAADVEAARGQKDLLAEEAPEEGVKVVPFEADSTTVGELLSETRDEENPFDIRYNALMHAADKPAKPKPQEMLTPEEAKAKLEEWKAEAKRQGKSHKNQNRTIMSLFDASGEWSQPWVDAGYNVWTFDIQNGEDINDFSAEFLLNEGFGDVEVWGILAAPPCTDFASSGAQFWAKKDAKGQTELSNELVMQVLRTVEFLQPKIWAMENPVGRIAKLNNLPPAHLTFDPNYYGDPYTKKTLLWGNFDNNLPMAPVEPTEGSKIVKLSGKDKYARSLTPEGFAYAFFMANNAENMTPAERLTRTYYGVDPKAFEGATEADEKAIDGSEFQDKYYDGDLEEAANIARNIIGKEKEEAPAKTEDVIQVNGRDVPVTMHRLEKENQLVEVNTDVFDKAFSKSTWQYVGEGGEGGIEGRYKKFAEFIKDAKSIEAPNVSVDKDGAIVFGDGRHRYAYLRDSGVENIPLSMDAESVKNAEKFGYIGKQEGVKPEPVTKTTVTEKKVPAPKQEVERKVAGRETEVAKLEVKTEKEAPKKPGETNTFYSLDAYVTEEDSKRSTSLKRAIKTLNRMRLDGRITDEQFVERADAAILEDEQQRLSKDTPARQRGYLLIQERLSAAVRRGELSRESFDLASWFMSQNEDLVKDLGVSVKGKGEAGVGGFYDALYRVANIIKGGSSDLTAVHEILHHLERMMPAKVQQAIRKTWASQLAKAAKNAKTPAEKLYFAALMEAHYGSNRHSMLNIPEGAGKDYAKVRAAMEDKGDSSADFAQEMLKLGLVPMANYEYVNPSEFWAVNGSDVVKGRYDAVKGGVLARLKNWLKELGQKIKSIFGMKSDASIIRALDSLAKSDGEFVTKDMLGQGNYLSIKNYKGNAAPTALWDSPEKTFLTDLEYQLVDKQVDLKDVIKQINKTVGTIDERLDAYTKETLYHGRAAERIKDFLEDKLRPLFEQMKKDGVSQEQLEEYLHNRHAEERNDQINKINLSPDVYDKGSGIDTTDAQNYLASLSAQDRVKLQSLAAKVDNIIEGTQQTLVDNGLETQETIDTWNKTYKHYVPLQRDDLDFIHTGSGYAGGYGTKGSASKRAVGSVKPVKDIIANIAIQREKAIRRGEQARIGRALYALAITNPNPKFWLPINPNAIKNRANLIQEMVSLGLTIQDAENLIKPLATPQIDKVTGLVKYEVNRNSYNSDNVFPVRINGEDRFIVFNPSDERAKRMSESLKNLNQEELGWALGTMGQVTRWISSVNTQYNPVFGAWNMARDVESAAFNLSTTEIAGHEKEVLRGTLPAMFAIYRDLRGKAANTPEQQAWIDDFNEMRLAGGTTGYSQQFSQGRDKANIVEKEFKRLNQNTARKAAQKVFDWLSDYNDAMENAVRLSAYRVALRETGSVDKAASIAKELTVNFNRKGASGPTMQALYSFINASIQGTKRLLQTLKGPMGKKIIAGGIMLGVAQAIALALNGYDDGDPPEFLKDKNFIIPIPFMGSNYIIIPMPMGLNIFPGIGRILTEAVLIKGGLLKSNKGPGDKAVSMLSLVLDSFNPLGAGSIYQQLTPTAFDPLVAAFVANKDAFGRPISREDRPTAPTPGYERSRDSATVISQGLAMFMNWSTSPYGTKHTKGFLSPTADQIDYVVGQYTGGVGREVLKGAETIKNKVAGEETPSYRIPIVGKLYGETKTPAAISSKFYDNVIQMSEYEHEIKQREKNNEPTEKYMKENPSARLWKEANSFEREVGKINKEKREAVQRKASRQEIKRIEDKRVAKMKEFNDKVRSTQ